MIYSVNETCSCGAKFVYSETVSERWDCKIEYEHCRFLEAHKDCRTKAVISSNKELKLFLVDSKKEKAPDKKAA